MRIGNRSDVLLGLAIPLVAVAILVVLGLNAAEPAACVAFLAGVPMFSAMFATARVTGAVALLTVLAAAGLAAATYDKDFAAAVPILVGVIIGASAAVMASQARVASATRWEPPPPSEGRASTAAAEEAETDVVTGLPSRRATLRMLEGAADGPRVVAVIGCDGMAAVNAERGREIGDVFLFAVAGRTRWALPEGDVVARGEGDEIIVVLAADATAADPTLRLIADKVNANPIRTDSGLVPLTISVGAVAWREGLPFADAVSGARRALHEAKASGPGHVVLSADVAPDSRA